MNNHRIQQFTSSGTFVAKWGSLDAYGFKYPYGVAVDGPGRKVYVTDNGNHRLLGFDVPASVITPVFLLLDE
jgi:tripartite motif-containing protein 71